MFATGSEWCAPWFERVLPNVVRLVRHAPEAAIYTRFIPPRTTNDALGAWQRYYRYWHHMTLAEIDPRLIELAAPLAELAVGHTVIDKAGYSPFHDTGLRAALAARNAQTLVVTGTETDVCVAAAVAAAVDCGFRVIVAADAVCSSSDQTHDAQMNLYRQRFRFQIEVADVAEIIAAWSPSGT